MPTGMRFSDTSGQVTVEYTLVAVVLCLTLAALIAPGAGFFMMIGQVYRGIAEKVSLAGI